MNGASGSTRLATALIVFAVGFHPPSAAAETVVAVAASMKEVVDDAVAALAREAGSEDRRFLVHVGGSGALARQIERGAPVDVFVSAGPDEIDALEAAGLSNPGSRVTLASNRLVMIAPPGDPAPRAVEDLAGGRYRRIALGNPRTAPVGRYARDALVALGEWQRIRSNAVFGEHVRQVVEYVARGDVDAGVVYASDASRFEDRIVIGELIPEHLHPPIRIEGTLIDGRPEVSGAETLLRWLASDSGRAAFARRGFAPWNEPPP